MIDEKKLIEALKLSNSHHASNSREQSLLDRVIRIVKEQPKIEWIPVEERLLEPFTDVLVWFEYFRYGNYNCLYQTYGISQTISFDGKSIQFSDFVNGASGWHKLKIIAWIPLQKPYKGENEE